MHVSFRLFLPTCITQKLILSSSKLPIEPTVAVYHVREGGRHLLGLWATACSSMTKAHSNSAGCIQIRRRGAGSAVKLLSNNQASCALLRHTGTGGDKSMMGLKAGSEFKDPKPQLKGLMQTVGAAGTRPHLALILHNTPKQAVLNFYFFFSVKRKSLCTLAELHK